MSTQHLAVFLIWQSDTKHNHSNGGTTTADAHSLASMIDEVLGAPDVWEDGLGIGMDSREGGGGGGGGTSGVLSGDGNVSSGREARQGHDSFDKSTDDMLDDLMFGLADLDDDGLGDMSLKDELPLPMTEFSWDADDETRDKSYRSSVSRERGEGPSWKAPRPGRFDDRGHSANEAFSTWQDRTDRGSPRTSRRTVFYHENGGVNSETCAEKKNPRRYGPSLQSRGEYSADRLMRRGLTAKPIYLKLGPLFFPHSAAAYSFFSSMLWETKIGYVLSADEMDAFVDLIERAHPKPEKKLGVDGLRHIYVGKTMKEVEGRMKPVRAFMLARNDGSEDDCSYRKLLSTIYGRIEHEVEKKQLKKRERMRITDEDESFYR